MPKVSAGWVGGGLYIFFEFRKVYMYFLAELGWCPAKFTIQKSIFVLFGRFWVVLQYFIASLYILTVFLSTIFLLCSILSIVEIFYI